MNVYHKPCVGWDPGPQLPCSIVSGVGLHSRHCVCVCEGAAVGRWTPAFIHTHVSPVRRLQHVYIYIYIYIYIYTGQSCTSQQTWLPWTKPKLVVIRSRQYPVQSKIRNIILSTMSTMCTVYIYIYIQYIHSRHGDMVHTRVLCRADNDLTLLAGGQPLTGYIYLQVLYIHRYIQVYTGIYGYTQVYTGIHRYVYLAISASPVCCLPVPYTHLRDRCNSYRCLASGLMCVVMTPDLCEVMTCVTSWPLTRSILLPSAHP